MRLKIPPLVWQLTMHDRTPGIKNPVYENELNLSGIQIQWQTAIQLGVTLFLFLFAVYLNSTC